MALTIEEYANKIGESYWTIQRAILSGKIIASKNGQRWMINEYENRNYPKEKIKGKSKHPLYAKWVQMRNRCSNKNHREYKWYGGKGIQVCDEWDSSFENFVKWSNANGWESGLSLDRINPNDNYSPHNCRWATWKEQGETRTNNKSPISPITATLTSDERTRLKNKAAESKMSMSGYVRQLILRDIES